MGASAELPELIKRAPKKVDVGEPVSPIGFEISEVFKGRLSRSVEPWPVCLDVSRCTDVAHSEFSVVSSSQPTVKRFHNSGALNKQDPLNPGRIVEAQR